MPVSEEEKEKLRADIDGAAARTANRLLFGLRDGLDRQAFRQCLDCLEHMYVPEIEEVGKSYED